MRTQMIALILVLGCDVRVVDNADTDVEVVDAGMVDAGMDDCAAACANLARLECDGAEGSSGPDEEFGTPDDVSCADVCRNVMSEGIDMHPTCVSGAASCDAADACFDVASMAPDHVAGMPQTTTF